MHLSTSTHVIRYGLILLQQPYDVSVQIDTWKQIFDQRALLALLFWALRGGPLKREISGKLYGTLPGIDLLGARYILFISFRWSTNGSAI